MKNPLPKATSFPSRSCVTIKTSDLWTRFASSRVVRVGFCRIGARDFVVCSLGGRSDRISRQEVAAELGLLCGLQSRTEMRSARANPQGRDRTLWVAPPASYDSSTGCSRLQCNRWEERRVVEEG